MRIFIIECANHLYAPGRLYYFRNNTVILRILDPLPPLLTSLLIKLMLYRNLWMPPLDVPKSSLNRAVWIPTYIKHDGYDLVVITTREIDGKLYLWIFILGSQRCADKFKYHITFFNKEEKSVHMYYSRNLISIDTPKMGMLNKKDSILELQDFMVQNTHQPSTTLRSRTLENQRISFKITIQNK